LADHEEVEKTRPFGQHRGDVAVDRVPARIDIKVLCCVAEMRLRELCGVARAFLVKPGDARDRARLEVWRDVGVRGDVEAGEPRPETASKRNCEPKADVGGRCRIDVN
jgi:hypothetical protein